MILLSLSEGVNLAPESAGFSAAYRFGSKSASVGLRFLRKEPGVVLEHVILCRSLSLRSHPPVQCC